MILTKDNLLRFVKERKYVIPINIAESFDTTTTFASMALSELSKDKLIKISNLKIGSTPYYYDLKQKESLIELGEKHFSGYEKEVFLKLKENKILNDNSLNIQERLAIERIKDFAIPLIIENNENKLKFWVWYLRDLEKTKNQILIAISKKNTDDKTTIKSEKDMKIIKNPEIKNEKMNTFNSKKNNQINSKINNQINNQSNNQINGKGIINDENRNLRQFKPKIIETDIDDFEDKIQSFIKGYFNLNYLKQIKKEEKKDGIYYKTKVNINNIKVVFEAFYFFKKPKDFEVINFYTSSQNPKIIFIQNASKKYFKLVEGIENLTIVNI